MSQIMDTVKYRYIFSWVDRLHIITSVIHTTQHAMGEMIRVAEHINSMKRKYDAAVHVQEIQSLLHDWEVSEI